MSKLKNAGALEEVVDGVLALVPAFQGMYDRQFGLVLGDNVRPDPEKLIV